MGFFSSLGIPLVLVHSLTVSFYLLAVSFCSQEPEKTNGNRVRRELGHSTQILEMLVEVERTASTLTISLCSACLVPISVQRLGKTGRIATNEFCK